MISMNHSLNSKKCTKNEIMKHFKFSHRKGCKGWTSSRNSLIRGESRKDLESNDNS